MPMKTLISATEVATIALGTTHTLSPEEIPQHAIAVAERRYLRPVLGRALHEALLAEERSEPLAVLTTDYLKAPLALYTLSSLLPSIAAKVGSAGVVRLRGENFEVADKNSIRALGRHLRREAKELMAAAVEYIEDNAELFPQFDPQKNVLRRVSLAGGVVLEK